MKEEWKLIDGFQGKYEVSNKGRVRSKKRKVPTVGEGTRTYPSKVLKPQFNLDTCKLYLGLYDSEKKVSVIKGIASLVMNAFEGKNLKNPTIVFKNGKPCDCRLENLVIVEGNRNNYYCKAIQSKRGGRLLTMIIHKKCKRAIEILIDLLEKEMSIKEIAEKHRYSRERVTQLNSGRSWKLLPRDLPSLYKLLHREQAYLRTKKKEEFPIGSSAYLFSPAQSKANAVSFVTITKDLQKKHKFLFKEEKEAEDYSKIYNQIQEIAGEVIWNGTTYRKYYLIWNDLSNNVKQCFTYHKNIMGVIYSYDRNFLDQVETHVGKEALKWFLTYHI